MRTLPRRLAVLALVSTTVLAGCGGSSGSDDAKPSSDPTSASAAPGSDVAAAAGDQLTGNGYSYRVPDGWGKPKAPVPGTESTDTFAADLTDDDGFSDNVNVIRQEPAPPTTPDELEKVLPGQLESETITSVEVRSQIGVDGETAAHFALAQTLKGRKNVAEQYYVTHDGAIYVVTFSFSPDVPTGEREKTSESILASWKWAG